MRGQVSLVDLPDTRDSTVVRRPQAGRSRPL